LLHFVTYIKEFSWHTCAFFSLMLLYPTEFESLAEVCSESAAGFGCSVPVTVVVAAVQTKVHCGQAGGER